MNTQDYFLCIAAQAWLPQIALQLVVLVWRLYQKIIEFLLKSLPLQQEYLVYDTRKVEEVFTYWVARAHCPASLRYSQDKLRPLREITCMRVCWLSLHQIYIFRSMHGSMYEKYESYNNYYDDYFDDIIAKNLPITITNSANYIN